MLVIDYVLVIALLSLLLAKLSLDLVNGDVDARIDIIARLARDEHLAVLSACNDLDLELSDFVPRFLKLSRLRCDLEETSSGVLSGFLDLEVT